MTPNDVIYHIKQSKEFTDAWNHFSREEKEEVIKRLEDQSPKDIAKVLTEVKTGQYRLF
ncbi:MAG: hypothetical protein KIS76_03760 [Pyrinomonadaceae bacterium]|nr:hypothetical protein [Pyrinomonadaceae bacterium]